LEQEAFSDPTHIDVMLDILSTSEILSDSTQKADASCRLDDGKPDWMDEKVISVLFLYLR